MNILVPSARAKPAVLLPRLDDVLLTRPEAARYLRVTIPTLDRWAMQGVGPQQIRVANTIRYRLSTLRSFERAAKAA
jgi:hypothetical protein